MSAESDHNVEEQESHVIRLLTEDGKPTDASSMSRGVFGANVGLERLLNLFKDNGIQGTFNIPSHTIEVGQELAKRLCYASSDDPAL